MVSGQSLDTPLPNGSFIAVNKKALGVAKACRDGISQVSPFTDFRDYLELALDLLEEKYQIGIGVLDYFT